jgi:hypothetical protein
MLKNKVNLYSILFFLFIFSKNAFSCPCFNSGFLFTIFSHSKNTLCEIQTNTSKLIYASRISAGNGEASSDSTGCLLKADYQNINRSFDPSTYTYENRSCFSEILSACKTLKAQINYTKLY